MGNVRTKVDALADLGTKVTGKDIDVAENDTIVGMLDKITKEYTGGGGGGTSVVANPVLAGTEDTLTGLQVGNTKYKINNAPEYPFPQEPTNLTRAWLSKGRTLTIDFSKLKPILQTKGIDLTEYFTTTSTCFDKTGEIDFVLNMEYEDEFFVFFYSMLEGEDVIIGLESIQGDYSEPVSANLGMTFAEVFDLVGTLSIQFENDLFEGAYFDLGKISIKFMNNTSEDVSLSSEEAIQCFSIE